MTTLHRLHGTLAPASDAHFAAHERALSRVMSAAFWSAPRTDRLACASALGSPSNHNAQRLGAVISLGPLPR